MPKSLGSRAHDTEVVSAEVAEEIERIEPLVAG